VLRAAIVLLLLVAGASPRSTAIAEDMSGYTFVHDPSMIKQGHVYYLFSTGDATVAGGNIQIRTSTDLKHWKYTGTVFQDIPRWVAGQVDGVTSLWAPDISYYGGSYHLNYAASTFGSNNSVIGLATTPTLDQQSHAYRWTDRGLVAESTSTDNWNDIDPNLSIDVAGRPWLAFGSFWSGIKLTRVDADTGKPASPHPPLQSIAYRAGSNAIEAPFVVHRAPYYYLFVSFDRCCQGMASTCRIVVGRSRAIVGQYVNRSGTPMMSGGGTQLLASNGYERGPGGQSVTRDGNSLLLVYHYYDARNDGSAKVQIRRISWSGDGWPQLGPRLVP
jgi:arabinan endo-1,5-alpha-L-arabinosidase